MRAVKDIYRGANPIDLPAYTVAAAAHYLRLPLTTVRYWALGRAHYRAVILAADPGERLLSFRNLVELHVLGAVRRQHAVSLPKVRRAVEYLRREFGSEHPLSDEEMLAARRHLFVKRLGQLIEASEHGQLAIEKMLEAHLRRVGRDPSGVPIRLFPFTRPKPEGPQSVVIDPRVQFGRPCIHGSGVPTAVVAQRFKAGESTAALADDYRRPVEDIEEAIRYETELQAA
jgi:uncharacterized protein (DUF433 family)